MQVILQKDIKKLGQKGDVIEVSDGYGRNYLLPKGLAIKATGNKIKLLEQQKKVKERKLNDEKKIAEELARKMEEEKFIISVKAGEKGRLFGSVTTKDIEKAVKKAGYKIDKRKISLNENIKSLGIHMVKVKIFNEVTANIRIQVVEA